MKIADRVARVVGEWTLSGLRTRIGRTVWSVTIPTLSREPFAPQEETLVDSTTNEVAAVLVAAAPQMLRAIHETYEAMLAYGPLNDGTPAGQRLEACMDLLSRTRSAATFTTADAVNFQDPEA